MPDTLTPEQRHLCMSRVKGRDTKPEILIRKALHNRGFRYGLHNKKLPGKPDLVLPKYGAVIFINGCFWHQHDCHLFKWPSTNRKFWKEKLNRNKEVDERNYQKLKDKGWYILTIWECVVKGRGKLSFDKLIDQVGDWLVFGVRDRVIKGRRVTGYGR